MKPTARGSAAVCGYGSAKLVRRCAVLSVESRAGQYQYTDIEVAVAHLHGMLDAPRRIVTDESSPTARQHRKQAQKGRVEMAGTTGYHSFDTTVDKTNRLLKEIEQEYGWPKDRRNQSYAALRGVLHALRDRMTVEESAQFAAQLPMLVRGLYYEGWNPTDVPVRMGREEFLNRVRQEFPYEVKGGIQPLVSTVLRALKLYGTEGEWEDIKSSMPKELATVVP
jgi:uncharacterized protein (DUF2267 family)